MTKPFLKFPTVRKSYLPRRESRRFRGFEGYVSAAFLTDAPPADTPADTRKEEDLLVAIDSRIEKALGTRATKKELDEIRNSMRDELKGIPLDSLRAMADDKTGVMATVAKQGLEIQRLQTSLVAATPVDMSIRGQVARWQEENKADIEAIRNKQKVQLKPLNIRAVASPMHVSTVNSGVSPYIGRTEVEAGINDFLRAEPNFWNYLTKGRTNATTYVWVNKFNPQGAAAWIGPGVSKPGVSFELVAETSIAKKIADSAKAGTELLSDIDGMTTFIEQELRYQVMIKVNSVLMTSAGSSTVPTGIQNLSTTYTRTDIFTTNPNYMDAIRAVVGQMRAGFLTGPITIFINPVDSANMDMAKANTSGVYMLPPFMTADGRTIAGATIVEDYNVPVGHFQAAYLRFYRILIYEDFNVAWGWENDDFTKNLVTAVGEMRLHQFFNDMYTGAFVYDTFLNVMNALSAANPVIAP